MAGTPVPDFTSRDPLSRQFWDERFEKAFTPWERGGPSQALRRFVAGASRPLRTLIPGCGSARELVLMCEAGWEATAIDFSAVAVARAKALAGPWAGRVHEADFFAWTPPQPLDLVYEQAFLCALPRVRRPDVARRWEALLAPGALLAGYFFFDDVEKGPPFGIAREELDALLAPAFDCIADEAVEDSIPVFAGKERWMVWRKKERPAMRAPI
ncbi:SAM-dependent methyltransferase [Massilia sp. YIM B02763]|uniref:methyltransferase domain-containing protein n=1 Tax=Massilia sp. YIM B02763 TaxID=3050130 RepID=UPI0025B7181C|nr:methyltransferase domain-containing protein [Massilia sp. YIM B02763]MDN4056284.1 SAM-dependent methyltransferase [Massilia sp. YIM B02763]